MEKIKKDTSVYLTVTPEEKIRLKELAEDRGLSFSSYARLLIYKSLKKEGLKERKRGIENEY